MIWGTKHMKTRVLDGVTDCYAVVPMFSVGTAFFPVDLIGFLESIS